MTTLKPAYGDGFAGYSNPAIDPDTGAGVLYIQGDEGTNGSLRIIPDTSFQTEAEFQLRRDDVWNDTGILIAASTIYLGRELRLSAGGEFIFTRDVGEAIKSLVPHVRYDDETGSESLLTVPRVQALLEDQIQQPDDTAVAVSTDYQFEIVSTLGDALFTALSFRFDVQAPAPMTLTLYRGSSTALEDIFYKRTYSTSQLVAGEFKLQTDGLVLVQDGDTVTFRLESEEAFSIQGLSPTPVFPWFSVDYYPLEIVTFDYNKPLSSSDGFVLVDDNTGELVTAA